MAWEGARRVFYFRMIILLLFDIEMFLIDSQKKKTVILNWLNLRSWLIKRVAVRAKRSTVVGQVWMFSNH